MQAGIRYLRQVLLRRRLSCGIRGRRSRPAGELQKALKGIREQGYAFDDEEEELGVRCVSVPVLDTASECVAALSVCGTVEEIDSRRIPSIIDALRQSAYRIGTCLQRDDAAAS
jgi:DNA-binding IclR family transcriptional regulator